MSAEWPFPFTCQSPRPSSFEKSVYCLVDCDKLGHEAYLPGSPAHAQILQEFGPTVSAGEFRALFRIPNRIHVSQNNP